MVLFILLYSSSITIFHLIKFGHWCFPVYFMQPAYVLHLLTYVHYQNLLEMLSNRTLLLLYFDSFERQMLYKIIIH